MPTPSPSINTLFNSEGFICDPLQWNENVARAIARHDGLPPLTRDHWAIIRTLRDHYARFGTAPPAFSHVCYVNHLGKHCVEHLFRSQREAWRIAGLPDPGEEARAYM